MNANNTRNVRQALFQSEILEEEQAEQAEQAENDRLYREAEQAERARLALMNGDAFNNTDFDSMFNDAVNNTDFDSMFNDAVNNTDFDSMSDTYQPSNDGEENMRKKYLKYKIKYLNLKKLK